MTLTDWRDNLDILGPDLTLWPTSLGQEAMDLLETSEEARDLFVTATARALSDRERSRGASPTDAVGAPNS
jgi:hypothetical protein